MLDIGVQTKGILPEKAAADGIRQIKQAGFSKIDLNLDVYLKNSDLYAGNVNDFFDKDVQELLAQFLPLAQAMVDNSVRISQMHAPYPLYVDGKDEQNEYMQTEVIPKCMVLAQALEIPYVVIHPFKLQRLYGKEVELQENMEYFKMLIPLAKDLKVKICMENLYDSLGGRIVEGVCADPEEAIWYIDTLNELAGEELFGFCLDTGHLQFSKRAPYDVIKKLGNRIKVLHIHENDAVTDSHQMPFSFGDSKDAGLDWDGIICGLREIDYQGTLSFETFPCMNSFPKGMADSVLEAIYAVGEYLKEEIEKGN